MLKLGGMQKSKCPAKICKKCQRDFYYNESINQNICKCELPQCYTCTRESLDQKLCTKCENGYYPIYGDLYNINYPNLNCSKSPDGYYTKVATQLKDKIEFIEPTYDRFVKVKLDLKLGDKVELKLKRDNIS